jgi:hypothetical protein
VEAAFRRPEIASRRGQVYRLRKPGPTLQSTVFSGDRPTHAGRVYVAAGLETRPLGGGVGKKGRTLTPIHSELTDETEPAWMRPTVERLLAFLPESHCHGLGAIVLTRTNISANRPRARRARANRKGIALGKYHAGWKGKPAWIELVVDEIVKQIPKGMTWLQVVRDLTVGRVLFHEIGHHLDATNRSVGRTGEHGAMAWERRLSRQYLQQTYGYLRPLRPVFKAAARFAKMMAARARRRRENG